MKSLNPLFAQKFVDICERYFAGDEFANGPTLWIDALYFYRSQPKQVVKALALMAKAHILEDLPLSLFDLESQTGIQIDEAQYSAALDDIIECLKMLDPSVAESGDFEDALISTLAIHFGIVRQVRRVRIRQLRKAAFEAYRRHRLFAIDQRKQHQDPGA